MQISNSEMTTWQRCKRKWYLAYYLGAREASESPVGVRILGIRVHTALEGKYGYDLDPVMVLDVIYRLAIEARPEFEAELRSEQDMAQAMVEGYIQWVADEGQDAGITVVATEQDISVPIPGLPGVNLRAKLDQVVWDEQRRALMFLDHKTADNFERHEIMDLDPQFRVYMLVQLLAAGPDGPRVAGGYRNTLRRVKRTAKAKPPFYQRDDFTYNPEQIESELRRITTLAGEISDMRDTLDQTYEVFNADLEVINSLQRSDLPPNRMPHDCRWSCPFVQLCPMMDDGSDWPGVITRSGKYAQGDPYDYYSDNPLSQVRSKIDQ